MRARTLWMAAATPSYIAEMDDGSLRWVLPDFGGVLPTGPNPNWFARARTAECAFWKGQAAPDALLNTLNASLEKRKGAGNEYREEGKGKKGRGRRSVDELRAHVNRLHAERGEAVLGAKKSREEQGFKSAAFQMDWQYVEDLTRAIGHYEAELERAIAARGGAEVAERATLLRDPAVELPDTQMNQVVVRGGKELSVAVYAVGRTWLEVDGQPIDDVTGWCGFGEAAEALKAATREVRHV